MSGTVVITTVIPLGLVILIAWGGFRFARWYWRKVKPYTVFRA